MHFNGVNNTQVFTDEYNFTFAPSNSLVKLTTSDKKFGLSSAYFNGGHLSCGQIRSLEEQFTIEFWWKHDRRDLRSYFIQAVNNAGYGLVIKHYGPVNVLQFYLSSNGTSWNISSGSRGIKTNWSNGVWYKVIFNYDGTTYRCFASTAGLVSLDWSSASPRLICPITSFNIGEKNDRYPLYGKMDEFRGTFGISRYGSSMSIWSETGEFVTDYSAPPAGPQGLQGLQGIPGSQGLQGVGGEQGEQGAPGEKWFTGAGAPSGGTGIVGDWYLNSSNGNYYEKTGSSTWTSRGNLRGPTGPQGIQGIQGDVYNELIDGWKVDDCYSNATGGRVLARTQNGDWHTIYNKDSTPGLSQVFYAKSVDNGLTWVSTQLTNYLNSSGAGAIAADRP